MLKYTPGICIMDMTCDICPYYIKEESECGLLRVTLESNQRSEPVKPNECNLTKREYRQLPYIEIPAVIELTPEELFRQNVIAIFKAKREKRQNRINWPLVDKWYPGRENYYNNKQ